MKRAQNKGFCLVEVLIAVAVSVGMMLILASILATASRLSLQTKHFFTMTDLGVTALDAAMAKREAPQAPSDFNVTVERQAVNATLTRITVHIKAHDDEHHTPSGVFMTMQAAGITYQPAEGHI